jgi:hypothetical protein
LRELPYENYLFVGAGLALPVTIKSLNMDAKSSNVKPNSHFFVILHLD